MPVCVHKGCEKTYNEEENHDTACLHHSSPPIFHEGLKGWQCCSTRVDSFDDFLAIPGCTRGRHSDQKPEAVTTTSQKDKSKESVANIPVATRIEDGVEIYDNGSSVSSVGKEFESMTVSSSAATTAADQTKKKAEIIPEEDDPSIPVSPGTKCKRGGCNKTFVDESTSRAEGGAEAECVYHPGSPVFHEGSKGWSCCSRKVLEFDEFLKIRGCKTGKHLFVGSKKEDTQAEEVVQCRHDWYQTTTSIIMSIYAKKVDKEQSSISFRPEEVEVNLKMLDGKRFNEVIPLEYVIDPKDSSFEVLSTKVELKMKKAGSKSKVAPRP
ncbi:9366_t:CDS:2 [Ambispora leptoticha]|uniref:9366_t:CDS:1 n=1 Tax=Ambispora leptoticha TaxID=144679 RepID=A0A9N9EW36_9GLOM|nr:9366_t:CDS:2 [Ambispora leptoticha]